MNRAPYSFIFYLKILALIMASMFSRPALFGNNHPELGLVFSAIALFLHIVDQGAGRSLNASIPRHNRAVLISVAILWTYISLHAMLANSKHLDTVFYALIANVGLIFAFSIVLGDERTRIVFFRCFVVIMLVPIASYTVTLLLAQRYDLDALKLFRLDVKGYEDKGSGWIYFPITPIYSYLKFDGAVVLRLQDVFREAGIAQAFLAWAFFAADMLWKRRILIKIFLLAGIVATISTVGLALAPVLTILWVISNAKIFKNSRGFLKLTVLLISGVIALAGSYFIALNIPYIGLLDKANYASQSISDRETSSTNGIKELLDNPLGIGLYNIDDGTFAGINLIGASQFIGVAGCVLVLFAYFFPLTTSKNKLNYMLLIMPLFITGLTSQPLLNAPLIYVMFLLNERELPSKPGRGLSRSSVAFKQGGRVTSNQIKSMPVMQASAFRSKL